MSQFPVLDPAALSAAAAWVMVGGVAIGALVAYVRTDERNKRTAKNTEEILVLTKKWDEKLSDHEDRIKAIEESTKERVREWNGWRKNQEEACRETEKWRSEFRMWIDKEFHEMKRVLRGMYRIVTTGEKVYLDQLEDQKP